MKKHLLIGIPSILLLMLSFGSLSLGLEAFYRYSFISEQIDVLIPKNQDQTIAALKTFETVEDVQAFSTRIISSQYSELGSILELLGSVTSGAKESFFVYVIFSGISAFLAVLLIVGLMPIFGKGSKNV